MVEVSTLERWFEQCPGALIAFSGGVDSSLVAYLAKHFLGADRAVTVISASPSLKLSDLDAGKQFARSIGLQLKVIATRELENPDYYNNPSNRCYFCKHTLYDALKKYAEGEQEVVDQQHICNEFALIRNKYMGLIKALDAKQFQINNIVKLRAAGLEDISL